MTRRNASRCTRKRRAFSRTRIPDRVGILRFAVSNLFSWGETALTTVEQVNRWLCQPAVIPIAAIRGETREYLLSNILRAVHIRVCNRIALIAHV